MTDEPCPDCAGKGWDHFESSRGNEIQRCDYCKRYEDDDAARKAHAAECGCDWAAETTRLIAALDVTDAMEVANALRAYAKQLDKDAAMHERQRGLTLAEAARARARRFIDIAEAIDCDPIRVFAVKQ